MFGLLSIRLVPASFRVKKRSPVPPAARDVSSEYNWLVEPLPPSASSNLAVWRAGVRYERIVVGRRADSRASASLNGAFDPSNRIVRSDCRVGRVVLSAAAVKFLPRPETSSILPTGELAAPPVVP